jgi:hypothetical protein
VNCTWKSIGALVCPSVAVDCFFYEKAAADGWLLNETWVLYPRQFQSQIKVWQNEIQTAAVYFRAAAAFVKGVERVSRSSCNELLSVAY